MVSPWDKLLRDLQKNKPEESPKEPDTRTESPPEVDDVVQPQELVGPPKPGGRRTKRQP